MYLVFDIGATNTRVARSKDGNTFDRYSIVKTPKAFDDGMNLFKQTADSLLEGAKVKGIGGGIAGPLVKDKTGLADAKSLAGWARKPLTKTLEKSFGAPAFLENDTAVVGLGELHHGAGKGAHIAVYMTVSTGVGGCRFVDGEVDQNSFGFEPGHQIIQFGDKKTKCGCGGYGHLEGYISGTAIEKLHGVSPQEITDTKVWDNAAHILAVGLNNISVLWSPDVIILGGSMMKKPGISITDTKKYLKELLTLSPQVPKVVHANLGDLGGLYGGLVLIQKNKK